MNIKKVAFWGTTILFSIAMGMSAIFYLTGNPQIQEGFQHLGYPVYLITFLGIAKLLGSVAILQQKWKTLKEWAYAGFTFNLLGAFYSHWQTNDPAGQVIAPLIFLALLITSHLLSGSFGNKDLTVKNNEKVIVNSYT